MAAASVAAETAVLLATMGRREGRAPLAVPTCGASSAAGNVPPGGGAKPSSTMSVGKSCRCSNAGERRRDDTMAISSGDASTTPMITTGKARIHSPSMHRTLPCVVAPCVAL